jgi:hypothetical protein
MENSLTRPILYVLAGTLLVLLIPLVAMRFTSEVNWSPFDFFVMGCLLLGVGVTYVLITRYARHFVFRLAALAAVGTTFLLVWANLAVGLIGAGPHAGNLMYMGVVAVVILGTYVSNFTARGMERAMLATAGSLVLVVVIALSTGMQHYPASSTMEIISVNGFFIMLYLVAALLFRFARLHPQNTARL